MNLEERLYTSTEVAQILGVSLRSVYRYLEENKLQAEVKTATGRHRFTRQNILDFLYPNGEPQSQKELKDEISMKSGTLAGKNITTNTPKSKSAAPSTMASTMDSTISRKTPIATEEQDESVDWLSKFREAAKKIKTAEETEESSLKTAHIGSSAMNIYEKPQQAQASQQVQRKEQKAVVYYRSGVGGLKEIAQNIDKSARKSMVEYAFSAYSGLSLHKPIKPFSVLHIYARPKDREFFERILNLVPSDEAGSQLCIIFSNDHTVYADRKEMHGLYVVSDSQLSQDLAEIGETELASELNSF